MKIHLIAVGGSIMHNLAIALHKKGHEVSGSDDIIYEPAHSRLNRHGLLPEPGWKTENIKPGLDVVILGMHAKPDNPELLRALELKLPIVSFPQFIYEESKDKQRIVICGSHGKTSVTSMVMHVLQKAGMDFDYAVGSSIEGFEDSVKLSQAPVIIIEGDEYLSSPIDRRPKFMWYDPHVALINGIAWDHINVFPTYDIYVDQFRSLIKSMKPGMDLIYYSGDKEVAELVKASASHLHLIPTTLPDYTIKDGKTYVSSGGSEKAISVFGEHNLQNLAGAQKICGKLGINEQDFWAYAADFKGAGKRLEKVENTKGFTVFRDFAHAPSKVKASVEAVRKQFPDKKLVAVLELHTFSSLNKDFIKEYKGSLDPADTAIVYVDNEALRMKGSTAYTPEQIKDAFGRQDITFIDDAQQFRTQIAESLGDKSCLLLMSSGNLGGFDLKSISKL